MNHLPALSPAPVQRIVVLGCGGFIGSHLLDRLLRNPRFRVEGRDTSAKKIRQHLGDPLLEFHLESLAGERFVSLERAVRRADVFINLASI